MFVPLAPVAPLAPVPAAIPVRLDHVGFFVLCYYVVPHVLLSVLCVGLLYCPEVVGTVLKDSINRMIGYLHKLHTSA